MKKRLRANLQETADAFDCLPFQLHDFGFRGVSSVESAGIGGCAHLVNFAGTDTMQAILVARKFYGCKNAGWSVPASGTAFLEFQNLMEFRTFDCNGVAASGGTGGVS